MMQFSLSEKQIQILAKEVYFLLTESIVSAPSKNISEVNSSQESEATNNEHN